jgi:hypothetical protein
MKVVGFEKCIFFAYLTVLQELNSGGALESSGGTEGCYCYCCRNCPYRCESAANVVCRDFNVFKTKTVSVIFYNNNGTSNLLDISSIQYKFIYIFPFSPLTHKFNLCRLNTYHHLNDIIVL